MERPNGAASKGASVVKALTSDDGAQRRYGVVSVNEATVTTPGQGGTRDGVEHVRAVPLAFIPSA